MWMVAALAYDRETSWNQRYWGFSWFCLVTLYGYRGLLEGYKVRKKECKALSLYLSIYLLLSVYRICEQDAHYTQKLLYSY